MNYKRFLLIFILLLPFFSVYPKAEEPLEILFFHSEHCKACMRVKKEILPPLIEEYGKKIDVTYLSTAEQDNLNKLIALASVYADGNAKIPAVFCGDRLIIGRGNIEAGLPGLIEHLLGRSSATVSQSVFDQDLIEKEFRAFSVFTILSGGLIDGINPCAFTVIVFFISFLACYKYTKKEMIIIGSFYILAIFVAYLLIGLGLFRLLYALRDFYQVIKIFYMLVAGFCFVLCLLSLYDYVRFKKSGKPSESILQLPSSIKLKIHKVIGGEFRDKESRPRRLVTLVLAALSVGFSVSILEAVCTSQVYLPIITFVLKVPSLRLKALSYLILYNLMFIAPLILVFLLALLGTTSRDFSAFMQKRFGLIRIGMALLFAGLGVFLIVSFIKLFIEIAFIFCRSSPHPYFPIIC